MSFSNFGDQLVIFVVRIDIDWNKPIRNQRKQQKSIMPVSKVFAIGA